jgi:hypothetical protein
MLFALDLLGGRVVEVPLPAHYPEHVSNLSLRRVAPRFLRLLLHRWHLRVNFKRNGGRMHADAAC